MELYPLFNLNIAKFTCDDTLTDDVLRQVEKLEWRANKSNLVSQNDLFFHRELFDWFDLCLSQVHKEIGLPHDVKLPITSCWANKSNKLNAHHGHNHSNSIVSGIFYLSSHTSGATIFNYTNIWVDSISHLKFKQALPLMTNTAKVLPEKSTLLIFPSNIWHSVAGLSSNETRYSISFNTYLDGEVDDHTSNCRLEIRTKSVRDFYET